MDHEIQRGETVYVLKLSAMELAYLAHVVHGDACDCGRAGCAPLSCFNIELLDIADKEGIEYY